ncbi:MAG: HAD family hydrolase [Candidatus Limnocylindria bacterium]
MTLRAALFDVGDTLVEHWVPREQMRVAVREAVTAAFGEREWFDRLYDADLEPRDPTGPLRQETNRWYADWFAANGVPLDGVEVDRLRAAFAVPLDRVASLADGADEAVRWCKRRGLRVVLVTNTLSRGDAEVVEDWRRFGLGDAIDAVVSSHSVGWRKPHPAIFERALRLAGAQPGEAFHVGDSLRADVQGAQQLGIRAVWRRTRAPDEAESRILPDATIDRLSELPGAVASWR